MKPKTVDSVLQDLAMTYNYTGDEAIAEAKADLRALLLKKFEYTQMFDIHYDEIVKNIREVLS